MLKQIQTKIFMWLGKKLYSHFGQFTNKPQSDIILFSNIKKWTHKYGLSKWEMGISTPKQIKQIKVC